MNKTALVTALIFLHLSLLAQYENKSVSPAIKIPMVAGKWDFPPGTCEFLQYRSVPSLRLLSSKDTVILKDLRFTNGIIEYDIEPEDKDFTGFFFRRQGSRESEYFYLRVFAAGLPGIMAAVQYTPIVGGVNLWNLLPYCQGPASFTLGQWNHIKLVISGAQMLVYVNDLRHPALEIAQLEGNTTVGSLGFNGKAIIANLVVTPDATEGLSPTGGFDPFYNDPRYLRQWSASGPLPLPKGRELTTGDLPKEGTVWTRIEAERRGLVNLTRLFGTSGNRRVVWLKCRLKVPEAQNRRIDFGFTDEVWIFLNGKLALVDKNFFDEILCKQPRARCSTENTSFNLPFQAGENDLLIGIANESFGWGVIARFDTMDGIRVLND